MNPVGKPHDPGGPTLPPRSTETGVGLVEVAIGAVVLATLLGAILSATVHPHRLRQSDGELRLAFTACRNVLGELRSVPFSEIPTLDGVGFDVPGFNGSPGGGLRAVAGDPDDLPGELTVTLDKANGGVTLYRVRAAVTWSGTQNRQRFALETVMGERK